MFLLSCSPHTFENGFKSAYDFENKQINSFNLNMISDAPLRVSASAKVFVSQEEAFKLVAEDLHQWFPGLEKFKYDHSGASQKTFADGSSCADLTSIWGTMTSATLVIGGEGRQRHARLIKKCAKQPKKRDAKKTT